MNVTPALKPAKWAAKHFHYHPDPMKRRLAAERICVICDKSHTRKGETCSKDCRVQLQITRATETKASTGTLRGKSQLHNRGFIR